MKSYLFRSIIKKYFRILIAIVLVSSLGCGIMMGMANGFLSLKNTLNEYLDIMEYPDAYVETDVMTRDVLEKISAVPGVEAVDARLVGNLVIESEDGSYYTMQAMSYSEDEFQKVHYWEKTDEEAEYPILLEYRFCKINDIHAGDKLTIRIEDRTWNSMVKGVITRAEMIASHQIGGMEVRSTDIGYVYVPVEVLQKIDNPDVEAAESEWNEKNREFNDKEKDAEEEYEDILDELNDAEQKLKEKQKELDGLIKQAGLKKDELLKYREEVLKGLAELDEKEKELIAKRAELDQGWEKYHSAEAELAAGREEIKKQKAQLDETKKMLDSKRAELTGQLSQIEEKEKELAKTKEDLQNGREEIGKKLRELDETEKKLIDTKEELQTNLETLKSLKEYLLKIKEHIAMLDEIIRKADEITDVSKWAAEALDDLDKMLSDTEAMVEKLENIRDELKELDDKIAKAEAAGIDVTDMIAKRQEILDMLSRFGMKPEDLDKAIADLKAEIQELSDYRQELIRLIDESANPESIEEMRKNYIEAAKRILDQYKKYGFTEAVINEMVAKIDSSVKEIEEGIAEIDDGLKQISDGRALLHEKEKEIDNGLKQVAEGEAQLQDLRKAVTDGIEQVDAGLKEVAAGYKEIEKYEKQIKDGEEQLRASKAELDSYEKQWADGKKLLEETRLALEKNLKDIDDAIRRIDEEIAKGKDQLEEGAEEIRKNRKTANDSWLDALNEFANVKSELKKAKDELDGWHGYDEFCNQFMLRFDPEANPDQTLDAVCAVIGNGKIKNSYTREESNVENQISYNVDPLSTMALFVPTLFYLVAIIVECLFMSFMIRQCRREIGILRALGFGSGGIMLLFCMINAMVSAGGIVLGMLIGFGVTAYTGTFFQGFFYLYFFHYSFHWPRFLLACLSTILVGQISTVTSAGYISRIKPSEAMSRPAPGRSFVADKGIFSQMKLPPFVKYCVFSLMRNKTRLIFSLICLASSVVLIYTAISFDFSKNKILSQLFEDRIHYDCEIFLSAEPEDDFLKRLSESGTVRDEEMVYYYVKEISANGKTLERTVKALNTDSKLIGICDTKSNLLSVPEEGILLEKHTADELGVSVGDTVMTDGVPMKVMGIPDECESRFQYISNANRKEFGSPEMCSVICKVEPENENALMEFMSKEENYIYTTFTEKIYEGFEDAFRAFGICVMIILSFSILIGLVVIINTLRTNLQEQKKELCVLRTLGFQYSDISARLLSQSAVYFTIACLAGIPAGIAVTKVVLAQLEIDTRSYPFVNDFRVYLFTILLVLAYILASHFISMRTLKTWDLVESVKDKE